MKRIILCADDYGQNLAISQAIIELLSEKNLSATSCLVTSPLWQNLVPRLEPLKNNVDIGLHFNLTQGKPLSKELPAFFTLKDLLIKTHLGKLDKRPFVAELNAQFDLFVNTVGQLPDFIDGHQHVHQFPIIRDAVFDVYDERLREMGHNYYIRSTFERSSLYRFKDVAFLKQLAIQLTGGIKFKEELVKRKIPHNETFAGIYNFKDALSYARYFPRFLQQVNDSGLIMCHPALLSPEEAPEMANARHQEYLYLSSNHFLKQCREHDIKLVRFKDTLVANTLATNK